MKSIPGLASQNWKRSEFFKRLKPFLCPKTPWSTFPTTILLVCTKTWQSLPGAKVMLGLALSSQFSQVDPKHGQTITLLEVYKWFPHWTSRWNCLSDLNSFSISSQALFATFHWAVAFCMFTFLCFCVISWITAWKCQHCMTMTHKVQCDYCAGASA